MNCVSRSARDFGDHPVDFIDQLVDRCPVCGVTRPGFCRDLGKPMKSFVEQLEIGGADVE